jgi:hypothetical protein
MYWVLFFSAWGGFILGVLFMAVLAVSRENKRVRRTEGVLPKSLASARECEAKIQQG